MIGDLLGGIGSTIGGLVGMGQDDKEAKRILEQLQNLWMGLETPSYDTSRITPRDYEYAGDLIPETYDVQGVYDPRYASEGPEGRQAQLDALKYFQGVQRGDGLSPTDIELQQYVGEIGRQGGRNDQAVLESMARRGMGGGGNELSARILANQGAMDSARAMGDDLVKRRIEERLLAASQGAGIGSAMRAQDMNLSATNADIWNRFGEFLSNAMTNAARDSAAWQNQSMQRNLGEQQRISDQNVSQKNVYDVRNQKYGNEMAGKAYSDELQKLSGLSGVMGSRANEASNRNAANLENLTGLGWTAGNTLGGIADFGLGFAAPTASNPVSTLVSPKAAPSMSEDEMRKLIRSSM